MLGNVIVNNSNALRETTDRIQEFKNRSLNRKRVTEGKKT
jgi:hypothetical protein